MGRAAKGAFACEDPLTYLPRTAVQEFTKGSAIYDSQHPSENLYVVILGRVKITTTSEDGCQTVARIVANEGLFGESALLGPSKRPSSAVALDDVTVMAWSRGDLEKQIELEPRLGVALSQYLARVSLELQDRIVSMAVHKTPERVMLALLHLAGTLGTPNPDGSARVASLTHQTIAEYVGTSREVVTFQMNRLRRMGLLRYSRKTIDIYPRALEETLQQHAVSLPPDPGQPQQASGTAD